MDWWVVTYEFALSVLVLGGGGLVLASGSAHGPAADTASAAVGAVLAFWFTKRGMEAGMRRKDKEVTRDSGQSPKAGVK